MRICSRGDSEGNLVPLKCFLFNAVIHVKLILNLELTEHELTFGFAFGDDFLPISGMRNNYR